MVGAVTVMVCLWASAFVAIRFADRELSSGALALGRLLVGSAALGVLVLVRRDRCPVAANWWASPSAAFFGSGSTTSR